MFQMQVPIGNLPVHLVLLPGGHVAFVRVRDFKVIFDYSEVEAVFTDVDFEIGTSSFNYNTAYDYKNIPEMLAWIQCQKLIFPG